MMFGMMKGVNPQPSDAFAWVQAPAGRGLVCRPLEPFARHIFTTREWRLGSGSIAVNDADGWAEVAGTLDVDPACLHRLRQVHGATVVVARPGSTDERPAADIAITSDPSIALAVQVADCVPLLVADRRTGAVAAAHAGWRGLAASVPRVTVDALARQFGSAAADLVAAVGPAIGACCYEVGADVRDAFARAGFGEPLLAQWFFDRPQPDAVNPSMPTVPPVPRANHWYFDTWSATRHQLESAGLARERIYIAGLCTASHRDVLCSYRRDGKGAGRNVGVIRSGGAGR